MIIDISNELITRLHDRLDNVKVTTTFPNVEFKGKLITFTELSNVSVSDMFTSSGEQACDVSIEINIFASTKNSRSDAHSLRSIVDELFGQELRMSRDDMKDTPNYLGTNIYRTMIRYSFIVDKNKIIYRG